MCIAGPDHRTVGHSVRQRMLRAGRVLPGGVPQRTNDDQPGHHRPALGALQPQPVQ